jgi:hypothetical protein
VVIRSSQGSVQTHGQLFAAFVLYINLVGLLTIQASTGYSYSKGPPIGSIVGSVLGGVAFLAVIATVVLLVRRKNKARIGNPVPLDGKDQAHGDGERQPAELHGNTGLAERCRMTASELPGNRSRHDEVYELHSHNNRVG